MGDGLALLQPQLRAPAATAINNPAYLIVTPVQTGLGQSGRFPAVAREQRVPDEGVHAVADEANAAVAQADVDPARVAAAGRHGAVGVPAPVDRVHAGMAVVAVGGAAPAVVRGAVGVGS